MFTQPPTAIRVVLEEPRPRWQRLRDVDGLGVVLKGNSLGQKEGLEMFGPDLQRVGAAEPPVPPPSPPYSILEYWWMSCLNLD